MAADNMDLRIRIIGGKLAQADIKAIGRDSEVMGRQAQVAGEKANRGFLRMGRGAQEAGQRAESSFARIRGGLRGIASSIGLIGVGYEFKHVLEAGMNLQQQQMQLKQALNLVGVTGEEAYKKVSEAAIASSQAGGFEREAEFQSITNFLRVTKQITGGGQAAVAMALKANRAAVSLSRGAGLPFQSVQRYIGQALVGNVKRLQQFVGVIVSQKDAQYGVTQAHKMSNLQLQEQAKLMGKAGPQWLRLHEILNSINPQMQAHATQQDRIATGQRVLQQVQDAFQGSLKAYNNSTQGRLQNLKRTWNNLQAEIGTGLLPVMNKFAHVLSVVIGWLEKHKTVAKALLYTIAVLATMGFVKLLVGGIIDTIRWYRELSIVTMAYEGVVEGLRTALAVAAVAMEAFGIESGVAMTVALGVAGIAIAAVIAGIVLLIMHWKQVKTWVTHNWPVIAAVIAFVFLGPIGVVVVLFRKQLWGAIKAVWSWIKQNWPLLAMVLLGPFAPLGVVVYLFRNKILGAIKDFWKFTKKIFSEGIKVLTSPFVAMIWFANKALSVAKSVGKWLLHNPISNAVNNVLGISGHGGLMHGFGLFAHGGLVHRAAGGTSGTDTVPAMLSKGEYVLREAVVNRVGVPALNHLNAGGGVGGAITIVPGPVTLTLDGRTIARGVVRYVVERGARGPSSLVGGSLVTGAGGPTTLALT